MTALGMTDEEMAKKLGISRSTFSAWKVEYPIFAKILKEGKEKFDTDVVEKTLLKRATGYEYEEREYKGQRKLVKRVVKQLAPDVTALIFWLKNRNPLRWKDKQSVEVSGETTVSQRISGNDLPLALRSQILDIMEERRKNKDVQNDSNPNSPTSQS